MRDLKNITVSMTLGSFVHFFICFECLNDTISFIFGQSRVVKCIVHKFFLIKM